MEGGPRKCTGQGLLGDEPGENRAEKTSTRVCVEQQSAHVGLVGGFRVQSGYPACDAAQGEPFEGEGGRRLIVGGDGLGCGQGGAKSGAGRVVGERVAKGAAQQVDEAIDGGSIRVVQCALEVVGGLDGRDRGHDRVDQVALRRKEVAQGARAHLGSSCDCADAEGRRRVVGEHRRGRGEDAAAGGGRALAVRHGGLLGHHYYSVLVFGTTSTLYYYYGKGLVLMARSMWRREILATRVRPGDGSDLPPYRWWHTPVRTLMTLTLRDDQGGSTTYAVDVRTLGDRSDGAVRARLYTNGTQTAWSRMPAMFRVPGGAIDVRVGTFGVQRCHFVPDHGAEQRLHPHPRSAHGRRARFHRRHPLASRVIGALSAVIVLGALAVTVPQLVEVISAAPAIADSLGQFTSPISLTPLQNVVVTLAAIAASSERALRLRATWVDELAT